jgi:hypothetical protein
VLAQDLAVVHPVKLVATKNEIVIDLTFEKVVEVLPDSVRCSLIPIDPPGLCCAAKISTKLGVNLSNL